MLIGRNIRDATSPPQHPDPSSHISHPKQRPQPYFVMLLKAW